MSSSVFVPVGPTIQGDSNNTAANVSKDLKVSGTVIAGSANSTIGFYGVDPVAQPTSASVTDFASLKVALQNLGLIGT